MFTTVAVLRDPWEAHLLRGRLEAEGIPAIVVHEHHIAVKWYLSFALGGAKVQVPEDRREDAKEVATLARSGAFKALLREEFGELDDPRCPYCGSPDHERRRPYPRAALAILYSGLVGPMLPPKGWIYGCKACGARYGHELVHVRWTRWPLIFVLAVGFMLTGGLLVRAIFTTKIGLLAIGAALITSARWAARAVERETDAEQDANPDQE